MPKIALSLNINVKEIEKARLVEGAKGTYLNATIFVDLDQADQYGNHGMITQDVGKEERDNGVRGNILGNGKIVWRSDEHGQKPKPIVQKGGSHTGPSGATKHDGEDFDDDLPF